MPLWSSSKSQSPKLGAYSAAGLNSAYSQDALSHAIRAPNHELHGRNPELQTQISSMTDSVNRVQRQAANLRKAAGRDAPGGQIRSKEDVERELFTLTTKMDSLTVTVSALVQSLIGLGASAFNWSEGLGTGRRKGLAELVLMYIRPCSQIDPRLEDLCIDLNMELQKESLDWPIARPWEQEDWTSRDGRSPPPGASWAVSPQKSKFQLRSAVQVSLDAWRDPGDIELEGAKVASLVPAKGSVIRIKITIMGAQGLAKLERSNGVYCTCEIPGKRSTTFKTKVVNNTATPYWNEAVFSEYTKGDSLKFMVWDQDSSRGDSVLGMVLLEQKSFFPNGCRGDFRLEKARGDAKDSKLSVKIEIVDDVDDGDEEQPEFSPSISRNQPAVDPFTGYG